MSINFRAKLNGRVFQAPFSDQISRELLVLRDLESSAVSDIFGESSQALGASRSVSAARTASAVEKLLARPDSAARQFVVRANPVTGSSYEVVGPALSGLQIDGVYYIIRCEGDHWTIQSVDDLRAGHQASVSKGEPESLRTDNLGVVYVEVSKTRPTDWTRLLRGLKKLLRDSAEGDVLEIVVG